MMQQTPRSGDQTTQIGSETGGSNSISGDRQFTILPLGTPSRLSFFHPEETMSPSGKSAVSFLGVTSVDRCHDERQLLPRAQLHDSTFGIWRVEQKS